MSQRVADGIEGGTHAHIFLFRGCRRVGVGGLGRPPPRALAADLDTTADRVFGQPDFTTRGGLGDQSLFFPQGMALDRQGNLYVADSTIAAC